MTILKHPPGPLVVSLLFHAALLGILALFFIRPQVGQQWVELLIDNLLAHEEQQILPEQAPRQTEPQTAAPQTAARGKQEPTRSEIPIPVQASQSVYQGSSELLETPTLPNANRNTNQYSVGTNPYAQSALQGLLQGGPSGDGNVSYAVTGGRVRFSLPAGYKHNLGASGSATVQFRVDRFARLIPGSVVSIQHTEGRFFEAAKKALMDGSFSFDGAPEPDVVCRITLEFL
ncbi:MAG TPA: hypothetical protein PKH19_02225 [Candidatus Syntrophosphaera sp.]|nr:hypothetical protein [Candidatus Syntrophosphaera sp.]